MKKKLILLSLLLSSFLFGGQQEIAKQRMLRDLDFLESAFEIKYAPLEWKRQHVGFELHEAFARARAKINQMSSPTTKEFQHILRRLFNQTADYHVSLNFYSTESATLPLVIQSAYDPFSNQKRRYFVAYIDREALPYSSYPLLVGDEILTWNGQPIDQTVKELKQLEFGGHNTPETDQAFAELILTCREGRTGLTIPSGEVRLQARRDDWSQPFTVVMSWNYFPEQVRDFSRLKCACPDPQQPSGFKQWKATPITCLKQSPLFQKMMVTSHWQRSSSQMDNPYLIGCKTSFLPSLGRKVWEASEDKFFDAYIFTTPYHQKIGYVRIAHYMGDEQECEEFCSLIRRFQQSTDALVIDQLNNPGGSMFYVYGLISTLANKPMQVPKHHITLTQEEVYWATQILPLLEEIKGEEEVEELVGGSTLGGYPISFELIQKMKKYFRTIIRQWNTGNLYTEALPLLGIDEIKPHPQAQYTKPILLLTNALDFSGGDFFPAILQDHGRVTILGIRTSGAGGFVVDTVYPNHNGIVGFSLTGSLAERVNLQPIENLGVQPDIVYEWTVEDRRYHYRNYVQKILETLDLMLYPDVQ